MVDVDVRETVRNSRTHELLCRLSEAASASSVSRVFHANGDRIEVRRLSSVLGWMADALGRITPESSPISSVHLKRASLLFLWITVFLAFAADPYTVQRVFGPQIAGLNFYPISIVAATSIGLAGIYVTTSEKRHVPPAAISVGLFAAYFVVRGAISFPFVDSIDVLRELRILLFYLLVIPLFVVVDSRRECWALIGAMFAGTATALALFAIGQYGLVIPGLLGEGRLTRQFVNEATFVPSLFFGIAVASVSASRRGQVAIAVAVVALGGVVLSGTETLIIALAATVPLLYMGLRGYSLSSWGLWLLGCAFLALVTAIFLYTSSPVIRDCVYGVCPGGPSSTIVESLAVRVKEWHYWTVLFSDSPIFGTGLGVRYQDAVTAPGRLVGGLRGSSALFWTFAKLGIVGAALAAWSWLASARLFTHQWARLDETDTVGRALLSAAGASAIALLVKGVIHSNGFASIASVVAFLLLLVVVANVDRG